MKLTLETERLRLRPFVLEDAEAMFHNWASDPEVTKYLTWNPHETVEDSRRILRQWIDEYEKPERLNFAIVRKAGNELMGSIDVVGYLDGVAGTPVIGYCLARKHWNQGYMTEACRCLLDYLFSRGYAQVRIDAMVENTGSNRVIEKCGGVFQDTEKELLPLKNTVVQMNRYLVYKP